jgi:hypothetical protein
MEVPVYAVDLADNLSDLEQRLNALARQHFEPWLVFPIVRTDPPRRVAESPVCFCIIAVQQPRVEALPELDYRATIQPDHEAPHEPAEWGNPALESAANGCRPPSITEAIPFVRR